MPAKKKRKPSKQPARRGDRDPLGLRIVGGRFRGRKLHYSGQYRVRPMKERVREAIFNLIGPSIRGTHAVDLFAGTGALGLEAISRGAIGATLVEQHYPTAAVIRRNVELLGVQSQVELVTADVFLWCRSAGPTAAAPWAIFCSPPYDFFVDRTDAMLELIGGLLRVAPPGSVAAVESDARFDFGRLPDAETWDVRRYAPAFVGLYRVQPEE